MTLTTIAELISSYTQYTGLLLGLNIEWPDVDVLNIAELVNLSDQFFGSVDKTINYKFYVICLAAGFPIGVAILFLVLFKPLPFVMWMFATNIGLLGFIFGLQYFFLNLPTFNGFAFGVLIVGALVLGIVLWHLHHEYYASRKVTQRFRDVKLRKWSSFRKSRSFRKPPTEGSRPQTQSTTATPGANPVSTFGVSDALQVLSVSSVDEDSDYTRELAVVPTGSTGATTTARSSADNSLEKSVDFQDFRKSNDFTKSGDAGRSATIKSFKGRRASVRPRSRGERAQLRHFMSELHERDIQVSTLVAEMSPEEYQMYVNTISERRSWQDQVKHGVIAGVLSVASIILYLSAFKVFGTKYFSPLWLPIVTTVGVVVFSIALAASLTVVGRRTIFRAQAKLKNWFLQGVLMLLNVVFIPVLKALFGAFSCARKSCGPGTVFAYDMKITFDNAASGVGDGTGDYCEACTFMSTCPITNDVCAASNALRIVTLPRVGCADLMQDVWPSVIIIFIAFILGLPYVFYSLTKLSVHILRDLPLVTADADTEQSTKWEHQVYVSSNAVKELYEAFTYKWRYLKIEWLSMKFIIVFIVIFSWHVPLTLPIIGLLLIHLAHTVFLFVARPYINKFEQILAVSLSICNCLNVVFALFTELFGAPTAVAIAMIGVNATIIVIAIVLAIKYRKEGNYRIKHAIMDDEAAARAQVGMTDDALAQKVDAIRRRDNWSKIKSRMILMARVAKAFKPTPQSEVAPEAVARTVAQSKQPASSVPLKRKSSQANSTSSTPRRMPSLTFESRMNENKPTAGPGAPKQLSNPSGTIAGTNKVAPAPQQSKPVNPLERRSSGRSSNRSGAGAGSANGDKTGTDLNDSATSSTLPPTTPTTAHSTSTTRLVDVDSCKLSELGSPTTKTTPANTDTVVTPRGNAPTAAAGKGGATPTAKGTGKVTNPQSKPMAAAVKGGPKQRTGGEPPKVPANNGNRGTGVTAKPKAKAKAKAKAKGKPKARPKLMPRLTMMKKLTPEEIEEQRKQEEEEKKKQEEEMQALARRHSWHDIPRDDLTQPQIALLNKEETLEHTQWIVDQKLDTVVVGKLSRYFLYMGVLTFVGMLVTLNPVIAARLHENLPLNILPTESGREIESSKFQTWSNFTSHCCCRRFEQWSIGDVSPIRVDFEIPQQFTSATGANPKTAISDPSSVVYESWHCTDDTQYIHPRIMANDNGTIFDGLGIREFCATKLRPGCTISTIDGGSAWTAHCNTQPPPPSLALQHLW